MQMYSLSSSKMSAAPYSVVKAGKYEVTSKSLGAPLSTLPLLPLTTTAEDDERIGAPPETRVTAAETITIKMKNVTIS